jgi:AAA+ ATPase superfamily predicted ATPase
VRELVAGLRIGPWTLNAYTLVRNLRTMVVMSGNPFDYQRPLDPPELIDRGTELDALQRAAGDRVAIRLSSPRRFGKTSLLRAHLESMRRAGHHTCFIDFDRVGTVSDVAERLVDGLRELPADPERRIDRRLSRLGISIGTSGLTVQVAPRRPHRGLSGEEARTAIRDLLAMPGERSRHGDVTIVAMDEFQDLLTADDALDGLFRSVIQHQHDVAYVFAGSSTTLMRELFSDRERPFYGQARPLELPPLPEDETFAYVRDRLPDHPQREDAASAIVAFAAGHPQRTMLLAHHLYNRLDDPAPGETIAADVLATSLGELADGYISVWTGLDRGERAVAVALADGLSPTSRRVADEHRTPRSSLQRATERLESEGQLVVRRDGELQLLDPLFAEWIRRR